MFSRTYFEIETAASSRYFLQHFSNFILLIAFDMSVPWCKHPTCALTSVTLDFRCCRIDCMLSIAFKPELTSKFWRNTASEILGTVEGGVFIFLVHKYLKENWAILQNFSEVHIDGLSFELCSVSELPIGILQRTNSRLIEKCVAIDKVGAEEGLKVCLR